mgnify:CR=1 FL=1
MVGLSLFDNPRVEATFNVQKGALSSFDFVRALFTGEPAPELAGGAWINSEPLSMQGLRGRVVYVEFWTYG